LETGEEIRMETSIFEPPVHLSERTKEIWRQLVPERCRSIGRRTLLQTALEALDRADAARSELEGAALTTKTLGSGTIHLHPLTKYEKDVRGQFATIWASLGLGFSNYEDGSDYQVWLKRQEQAS
jgi:P27 family predicted phage terminase small subunit